MTQSVIANEVKQSQEVRDCHGRCATSKEHEIASGARCEHPA